jgi:uncharacterized membrane protein (DUF373 family)
MRGFTMRKFKIFFYNKFYIELILAMVLFVVAVGTDSMIEIIIYLLYFIIMLEIVRAVMSFLREKRVQIRILIDAFIILTLRELIVNVVKVNEIKIDSIDTLLSSTINYHILIFCGVILFLFILRWLAFVTSPDRYNKKNKSL